MAYWDRLGWVTCVVEFIQNFFYKMTKPLISQCKAVNVCPTLSPLSSWIFQCISVSAYPYCHYQFHRTFDHHACWSFLAPSHSKAPTVPESCAQRFSTILIKQDNKTVAIRAVVCQCEREASSNVAPFSLSFVVPV